jgi:pyruvate dehydrogenase E2 component (dihydrolipoamide acetyltransferase)
VAKTIDLVVPDLGDFSDVEIIEILVEKGDAVEAEDGLITLETDKAALDVPAPQKGIIESISVEVGGTVSSGDVIGRLSVESGDTAVIKPALAATPSDDTTVIADSPAKKNTAVKVQTLVVPDLGDFADVEVIEVHIAEGDTIAVDDPLITLETDKAAMDVPAVVGGSIKEVLVSVGEKVSAGSSIALIEGSGSEPQKGSEQGKTETAPPSSPAAPGAKSDARSASAAATSSREAAPARVTPTSLPPINEAGFSKAHASPSVRKLARELGVDLGQVRGSGNKQRILQDDIKTFVKAILTGQRSEPGSILPKVPSVDFAKFGEVQIEPLTRIQKISGPRLQASWINLPHVTQQDEADITELEARRQ